MSPFIALVTWLVLLLGLCRFDPAKDSRTSLALWVPLIWMFIVASRLPSQWLGGQTGSASQVLEEGNALDRSILAFLILLAIGILTSRSFNWGNFFARNFVLVAFLLFGLLSVAWSDFPFVAFKRWIRDLGSYFVTLIVLSDRCTLEAVRTLLRRLCYLLIPLSILLVKYFPQIGKQYNFWTGASVFVGPTTSKNMLGVVCLISGIFFFWDTATRWSDRKEGRTRRIILLNAVFMGMTLWLLHLADSATSSVCLVLGCLVIVAANMRGMKRHPALLRAAIPIGLVLYLVLELGLNISGGLAKSVGRNPTLTGRTDLWKILLDMHTNPFVGTGYESFWLGPRLQSVWQRFAVGITEAHNGYLEVYLNLGLTGLLLLVIFLILSYQRICRNLVSHASLATLSLALWTVLIVYNVSEAAFRTSQLMWLAFLLVAVTAPERPEDLTGNVTAFENVVAADQFPSLALKPTSLRQ